MKLKITEAERIALFDRLSRIAYERASTPGMLPALAAYYAEIALHYDKAARRLAKDYKIGSAPDSRGSTPKGQE